MNLSILTYLSKIIYKLPLGIVTDDDLASFSAHIGWSIAISIGSLHFFGPKGLYIATALWVLNDVLWKLFDRGHLKMILNGTEVGVDLRNLLINWASNWTIPFIICAWQLFR